ncbi:hypothetical protein [Peptostreptococcus porci]|uniref:hypothetical protein n=1 Tax=Peptostreptococcus porci TaxID=2652282 RepID=UPI0023F4A341|nr:hypothetical protein [Peptostreptococcus porci]MDD7182425.1 hypothetical protein [Peptostreptococcus porci]
MEKNNDEFIKRAYGSLFQKIGSEEWYLALICSKVLFCDAKNKRIMIDNERLFDELVYMRYYSSQKNDYLLDFFIPLVLVSKSFDAYFEVLEDLSDKITKFYKCNEKKYGYMMDVFIYDFMFREALKRKTINVNSIEDVIELLDRLKDGLLELNPINLNKKEFISFQKEKIKYINNFYRIANILNEKIGSVEVDKESIFIEIQDILGVEQIGKNIFSRLIYELFNSDNTDMRKIFLKYSEGVSENSFIEKMAEYILRIRDFAIQSKQYSVRSNPKHLLEKNVGDVVNDPVLNSIRVISKKIEGNVCSIIVDSKSGEYTFSFEVR